MPELPEVETTVRYLRERLIGQTIAGVEFLWHRTLASNSDKHLLEKVAGSHIQNISRRGKFIVMQLGAGQTALYMLAHLRMSGSFDVVSASFQRSNHDRFAMLLEDGRELRFDDPRKFGRIYIVSDPLKITASLGHEPLDPTLTPKIFHTLLSQKRGAIKPLLLNQSVIAGIGNIYADESLWLAGIHPLTVATRISIDRSDCLLRAIRQVLRHAIRTQGTDNGDGVVEGGMYNPRVYGREDQPCRRCKATIKKIVVGQRGTHFCPRCQKRR